MIENLTQSIEDYLKAIYELTIDEDRALTNDLAEFLEVTPASVSGMVKKLAITTPPLVEYQKHRGVVLTDEGQKVALETLRHHRLLELFLHQILGYPWDEVHDEADRLEHVISEKFEDQIAIALNNPNHDPHGDPIPRRDLSIPSVAETILSEVRAGERASIKRVRDTDPDLLRYLHDLGIVPSSTVRVKDYSEFDGNLHLTVEDSDDLVVLGPRITSEIYVEIL